MKLIPLPGFQDNYLWLLHDGHRALVVDPGDAQPVLAAMQHHCLQLEAILVTQRHADHIGGLGAVREATGAKVDGPAPEPIPGPPQRLSGDTRVCGTHEYTPGDLNFALAVEPGHTDLVHYRERRRESRRIQSFLRTREPAVIEAARAFDARTTQDQAGVFAAIRPWKNEFR